MLSLANHQKYLCVMDVKEKDLFQIDNVFPNVHSFFGLVDLGHDDDDKTDFFKRIKCLSKLIHLNIH